MNDFSWPALTEPLALSSDIVHVVRLELDADAERIEFLRSILSPEELVRADRFRFEEPRRRFIVCRAALRQLLGGCLNRAAASVMFEYGSHGKPQLVAATDVPRVEFSVSHSADLALIAIVLGRRVGVDVERHDAKVKHLKLAARFFSADESAALANLASADQVAGFYRGWTCKEAYLKATGFGLSFPLGKFTVAIDPHREVCLLDVVDHPEEAAQWRMSSLDVVAGFSAALLVEAQKHESVIVKRWSLAAGENSDS